MNKVVTSLALIWGIIVSTIIIRVKLTVANDELKKNFIFIAPSKVIMSFGE